MKYVDLRLGQPFKAPLGNEEYLGRVVRVYDTFELADFHPGGDLTTTARFSRTIVIQNLVERDAYSVPVVAEAALKGGLIVPLPGALWHYRARLLTSPGTYRLGRLPMIRHESPGDDKDLVILPHVSPIGDVAALQGRLSAALAAQKLQALTRETDLSEPE